LWSCSSRHVILVPIAKRIHHGYLAINQAMCRLCRGPLIYLKERFIYLIDLVIQNFIKV
jgi:hypothetical protein